MHSINIVWLKRDLRLHDHAPLSAAIDAGLPTLICYCFEPSLLQDDHLHPSHQRFIVESLSDLSLQLTQQGHQLHVFWCDISQLLTQLHQHFVIDTLFSHEEIGVMSTFQRDQQIAQWCQQHQVTWQEFPQFAVKRGKHGRKGWSAFADQFLQRPPKQTRINSLKALSIDHLSSVKSLKCNRLPKEWLKSNSFYQSGGETPALKQLSLFIESSLSEYCFHISKPDTSRYFSSRLSAYLAYGNLSLRQVLHTLHQAPSSRHKSAFYSRMRWHCHFIQKFESDCRIEFEPLNPAYVAIIQQQQERLNPDQQQCYFDAWSTGNTGYPLVDACMRALLQTGFVNFRMRSMLVSVACHHLQLDWKQVALHLARHFLDFEPGIHYPQIQMQAGLTGFNTLRIYNPVQQSLKQDAQAKFIQEFVPEIAHLPLELKHQPWLVTPLEAQMLDAIPTRCTTPIFNSDETGKAARERLWSWRKRAEVKEQVPALLRNQVKSDA